MQSLTALCIRGIPANNSEITWRLSSCGASCRSIGLQLFESIDKGQEAEAIELIDKESRSAYVRDANKHGYAIHHAVFQVRSYPAGDLHLSMLQYGLCALMHSTAQHSKPSKALLRRWVDQWYNVVPPSHLLALPSACLLW